MYGYIGTTREYTWCNGSKLAWSASDVAGVSVNVRVGVAMWSGETTDPAVGGFTLLV